MGTQYRHLEPEERGVIMAMRAAGQTARAIGRALGRAPSTITRELRRNGHRPENRMPLLGRPPIYDAVRAGVRARRLARKARRQRKLAREGLLWRVVRQLLVRGWSPQQISRTLRRRYGKWPHLQVSHETIYTAIYAMPRGELRRDVVKLLRQHKCARRPAGRVNDRRGQMPDLPSIHIRPPEANDRQLPGHWEGDYLKGSRNQSSVGVLVDRSSLFLKLVKVRGCSARDALEAFTKTFSGLPAQARQTLTYDQGKEMALHRTLSERTGLKIYFADPSSPWQRGICENINGLLRQYLPKGSNLSVHTQHELDEIAARLNLRPRVTLGDRCPADVFLCKLGYTQLAQEIDDALLP